jgi:hypothetical protein
MWHMGENRYRLWNASLVVAERVLIVLLFGTFFLW